MFISRFYQNRSHVTAVAGLMLVCLLALSPRAEAQFPCATFPCQNGGTCTTLGGGSFACACIARCSGIFCDTCDAPACEVDQYVFDNLCLACPPGTTNEAGDNPSGANTSCDAELMFMDGFEVD